MKIDIGPDGKILGTKRVSANGQISGFTEFAGAEVLVILPGGTRPVVRRDAKDVLTELEKVMELRMQVAFQEYKSLRRRFGSPRQAAQTFLRSLNRPTVKGIVERADEWLHEQAGAVEKNVKRRLAATQKPVPKK